MQDDWTEEFYNEINPEKRLEILKKNTPDQKTGTDLFRDRLWVARYGKRKPKNDAFVKCLMEMKYVAEGGAIDIGGARKKQAINVITELCLFEADKRSVEEQDILVNEIKNAFLKFIDVSRNGRGFTAIVFGMGQLSDESVTKKIAEQISAIAFTAPHMLHMDKEFALLQKAALIAFRQEYPNREHFLKK